MENGQMNQKDYTINQTFTLPSEGKVYSELVGPDITLRSMTTQEEMKRLSPSDMPYKNICEIIDDCIISPCNISSRDMCLADYRFLLYMLRVVTYGNNYKLSTTCPYCGCGNVDTIDLTKLPLKEYNQEEVSKYLSFELPMTKSRIELYLQTPRMVDTAQYNAKEYRKKSGQTVDYTTVFTIQELIKSIDGAPVNPVKITEWVKTLPMADTNTILVYADKANSSFGVDNTLHCMCDVCGLDYNVSLRADREFFRPSLDI